ncbi:hypothetical protein FACS189437_07220 [Bacteroidia bacterium]|nr:hypothetical protein FACS189437_07220 [Bacteroidia bacterium]
MNEFICTWGISTWIITIIYFILISFVFIKTLKYCVKKQRRETRLFQGIFLALLTFISLLSLIIILYMPLKLTNNEKFVCINQVKGNISISTDDICEVRRYTNIDSKNTLKVFASGGVFGYIGQYENPQIGTFQMYATDTKNRILIRTKDKIYVVSCNNSDIFISQVNAYLNNEKN